jgi:hypothetical protein
MDGTSHDGTGRFQSSFVREAFSVDVQAMKDGAWNEALKDARSSVCSSFIEMCFTNTQAAHVCS